MRDYELMTIHRPDLAEDDVETKIGELEAFLKNSDAEVTKRDVWGKRRFAYEIDHLSEGYYSVLTFRADDPANGYACEMRFEADSAPVDEGRTSAGPHGQLVVDQTRFMQHGRWSGWFEVDGRRVPFTADATPGLRDKSWGPRYWQAVTWYRWLPLVFGPDFAMMLSLVGGEDPAAPPRESGVVLVDGEYHKVRECRVESTWDADGHQTGMTAWARTATAEYTVEGEVISLIPLRNRRTAADGTQLVTRITEAMTRYRCEGRSGIGMSEYLDQVIDGRPVGPDLR